MDDTQRNNIRVLLPQMRGKPKAERMRTYAALRAGPLLFPMFYLAELTPPYWSAEVKFSGADQ